MIRLANKLNELELIGISLLVRSAFQADNFSHQDVFGHLNAKMLSAQDAAEYLEVSMPTFRRNFQSKKLHLQM